jgi:hypothetical protein
LLIKLPLLRYLWEEARLLLSAKEEEEQLAFEKSIAYAVEMRLVPQEVVGPRG